MRTASIGKEAVVQVPNRMGALTQVARIVSDKGIDIQAAVATVDGADAIIRLVTNDHQRTMDALRGHNLNPQEARVVMVEGESAGIAAAHHRRAGLGKPGPRLLLRHGDDGGRKMSGHLRL